MAVMSRPQAWGGPLSSATIVAHTQTLESRFLVAEDSPLVTDRLRSLILTISVGGKQIHDANIVATMLVYGIPRLLTHNTTDFGHYSGLITVVPLV